MDRKLAIHSFYLSTKLELVFQESGEILCLLQLYSISENIKKSSSVNI